MAACEKCWGDAFVRSITDTTKSQTEHYRELIKERENNPCMTNSDNTIPKDNPILDFVQRNSVKDATTESLQKEIERLNNIIKGKTFFDEKEAMQQEIDAKDAELKEMREALTKSENEKNEIANNANLYIKKLEQRLRESK